MVEPEDNDWEIDSLADEPSDEPVGSCDECGTNLYEEDDEFLCDQCLWRMTGGAGR